MLPPVSQRPRASLGRVLADLGDTLLELLCGDPEQTGEIGGVVIDDPEDPPVFSAGALVLGVGVTGERVVELVERAGAGGAVGVIVRSAAVSDDWRAAARRARLAVLGLRPGATWTQLTALLRSVLAEDDIGVADHESLGGLPSGDLFAVANAVAALLDAPITIEDRSSRVLAFSGRQDEADPSRVETVIGRQVPEQYARALTEQGVFRELYRQQGPVVVAPAALGYESVTKQRVAIAVRAGDEVLGSVWAVMEGAITPERAAALKESANLVALHLLRVRAGADVHRRLRTDLVSTAIEGGAGAGEALGRLNLAARRLVVVAASLPPERNAENEIGLARRTERLGDALAAHLAATLPQAAVATIGSTVYALIPATEERAQALLQEFGERVLGTLPVLAAVGPVASEPGDLIRSRETADRIMHVLREGMVGQRVARLADVQTQSLLLELRDLAAVRGERPIGGLARLIEYDERSDAHLIEALEAWLDALGDVTRAAATLFIHPNTLRYRLRRIAEVGDLDLDDPEQRFALMLQLRILTPR